MIQWMTQTRDESGIEGITFLGGEPFAHAVPAVALARTAQQLGLSVMVFSGYVIEELRAKPEAEIAELIGLTDILVDGPYDRDKPDTERRWIGSTNQRIHFLTNRYQFDEQWRKKNTLEIRVVGREISVNGFPAKDAVGLWKGWTRKKPLPMTTPDSRGTDAK
jgi:anaerobic ribonucleoside-triphosphate reductase activating protein